MSKQKCGLPGKGQGMKRELAIWDCVSRATLRGQCTTPADQNPTHHEEDFSPGIHEDGFVRVGFAVVLHCVVTTFTGTKHGLLAHNDQNSTRQGKGKSVPVPTRSHVDRQSNEKQNEGFRELVLTLHIASVKILLNEDPCVDTLQDTVDEDDDLPGAGEDITAVGNEAGESKQAPHDDKRPRRLEEQAKVGTVRAQPPFAKNFLRRLIVLTTPRGVFVVGVVEKTNNRDHTTSTKEA
mmetsp:Transcript_37629/g.74066  ORF Transcript_37629/g.74066 Transcript_37629/m.74066 type:complete len:237 (+) Transcript_37629:164-874(+)